MKTKSNRRAKNENSKFINSLKRLLRRRALMDYWNVGGLLHTRFGQNHNGPTEILKISKALIGSERTMPRSPNHLHKCCQFRRLWKEREVKAAAKVPWRRILHLTIIKALAQKFKITDRRCYDVVDRRCAELIREFPKCSVETMPEWMKKIESLKAECRNGKKGFRKKKQTRLMVDCLQAAVYRLNGAAAQIKKMRQFLPDEKLKHARAALQRVNAALKPLNQIYKRKKSPTTKS